VSDIYGYGAGQGGQPPEPPPGFGAPPPGFGAPPPTDYAPYGYPYPAPYPMMAPPQRSGLALTGMILGIIGLVTSIFYIGGVIGIIGLIFSIIGIRQVNRHRRPGKGMAIAGLVTSIFAIIINAIEIIAIIWFIHATTNCNQYADPVQHQQCVNQEFSVN
jgi:hypothetical protein